MEDELGDRPLRIPDPMSEEADDDDKDDDSKEKDGEDNKVEDDDIEPKEDNHEHNEPLYDHTLRVTNFDRFYGRFYGSPQALIFFPDDDSEMTTHGYNSKCFDAINSTEDVNVDDDDDDYTGDADYNSKCFDTINNTEDANVDDDDDDYAGDADSEQQNTVDSGVDGDGVLSLIHI